MGGPRPVGPIRLRRCACSGPIPVMRTGRQAFRRGAGFAAHAEGALELAGTWDAETGLGLPAHGCRSASTRRLAGEVEGREEPLVKHKQLTRARDALAAECRPMPRMAPEKEYRFDRPDGPAGGTDGVEAAADALRTAGVGGAARFLTGLWR